MLVITFQLIFETVTTQVYTKIAIAYNCRREDKTIKVLCDLHVHHVYPPKIISICLVSREYVRITMILILTYSLSYQTYTKYMSLNNVSQQAVC
jgi:hypothetical protein